MLQRAIFRNLLRFDSATQDLKHDECYERVLNESSDFYRGLLMGAIFENTTADTLAIVELLIAARIDVRHHTRYASIYMYVYSRYQKLYKHTTGQATAVL
eukprot:COSAG01_NODE_309_length_19142_cov_22.748149_16_plen_100_part_00